MTARLWIESHCVTGLLFVDKAQLPSPELASTFVEFIGPMDDLQGSGLYSWLMLLSEMAEEPGSHFQHEERPGGFILGRPNKPHQGLTSRVKYTNFDRLKQSTNRTGHLPPCKHSLDTRGGRGDQLSHEIVSFRLLVQGGIKVKACTLPHNAAWSKSLSRSDILVLALALRCIIYASVRLAAH